MTRYKPGSVQIFSHIVGGIGLWVCSSLRREVEGFGVGSQDLPFVDLDDLVEVWR